MHKIINKFEKQQNIERIFFLNFGQSIILPPNPDIQLDFNNNNVQNHNIYLICHESPIEKREYPVSNDYDVPLWYLENLKIAQIHSIFLRNKFI